MSAPYAGTVPISHPATGDSAISSSFMLALSGGGCVGAPIVSRKRAGTLFFTPTARSRTAGFSGLRPPMVCRAREGARCFVRWRVGVPFFHGGSVLRTAAGVSSVLRGGADGLS